MLAPENPQWGTKSAETLGGSPVSLHLYVEDADALFKQAVEAGCTEIAPMVDMFWGDRYGKVVDPFGIQWGIATHIEDVPPDEMAARQKAWMESMAGGQ
jgi:PhnB protein